MWGMKANGYLIQLQTDQNLLSTSSWYLKQEDKILTIVS